jgi:hypothetical protein
MSKTSAKQRYEQLTEWLGVRKQRQVKTGKAKRESRLGYYEARGNRG